MALSQQKFREIIFQLLYSHDIALPDEEAMVELIMAQLEVTKKNVKLAQARLQEIINKIPEIDELIRSVTVSYEFDRIHQVSKNILRLAIYELLFDSTIPPKVAIAEAIRLSRKFTNPESASFVNALLDHLYQKSLGHVPSTQEVMEQFQSLNETEERMTQLVKEKEEFLPLN